MQYIICPKCKEENPGSTLICVQCGASLRGIALVGKAPIAPSLESSHPLGMPTQNPQLVNPTAIHRSGWEYKTILRNRGYKGTLFGAGARDWDLDIEQELDFLGKEGWELVTIVPRAGIGGENSAGFTSEELWVFKRPSD